MQTRISFKCLHPFFHCLRICEICGSTACNVAGFCDADFIEQWNESSNTASAQATATEPRRFWQGHRFLKFLLACMVFAFVISWLCHFNVPGWVLSWCTLFLIKAPKPWQTKYGQVSECKLAEKELEMNKSCLGEMKGGVNFIEYNTTCRRKRRRKRAIL